MWPAEFRVYCGLKGLPAIKGKAPYATVKPVRFGPCEAFLGVKPVRFGPFPPLYIGPCEACLGNCEACLGVKPVRFGRSQYAYHIPLCT